MSGKGEVPVPEKFIVVLKNERAMQSM